MKFYVYIVFYENNALHSVGVTTNLCERLKLLSHLEKKDLHLVYYEVFENSDLATRREDDLSSLGKSQIDGLIRSVNPLMVDLGGHL